MNWIVHQLWLIPALPFLAAGVLALTPRRQRAFAARLAISALAVSLALSCAAFVATLGHAGTGTFRERVNFTWFQFGDQALRLGWVLDPLAAVMLVMVSFVGLLIFIYSVGYMAHDANFTRFFCFLALFAGAMLGLVIANSLLLLFVCWELVGLASYLLIGFWFHKPEAAAAAKKAFITTRIGDVALFLGMLWLYSAGGTLLFYDAGEGCLENAALARIAGPSLVGWGTLVGISLLIFGGAIGKSGQLPLHVWLPDAMEGPTPVSALIHAATMVAAGVFLVARVFPLMKPDWPSLAGGIPLAGTPPPDATLAITWVGAITAVFAALIAVAQTDIKRILAYSTVSQLGYMFLGLGVGGVAVGMFHLLTHACFKALLFLGAGSVIHGCHDEQDIRRMGGLRRPMPVTFATYAVGMMALSGVPLLFSGFWSKDEILHAAHGWAGSRIPFYLGLFGALLTAFYMTRQMVYVFFGQRRAASTPPAAASGIRHPASGEPHESPLVMTVPLAILAVSAIVLGFLGTPAWPWLQTYLGADHGGSGGVELAKLLTKETLWLMAISTAVVTAGIGLAWRWYGQRPITDAGTPDPLQMSFPAAFRWLRQKFFVDEFYAATVIRAHAAWARFSDLLDAWLWGGLVLAVHFLTQGLSWASRFFDEYVVNLGFDAACRRLRRDGAFAAGLSDGKLQNYLRGIGTAFACLLVLLLWGGCR